MLVRIFIKVRSCLTIIVIEKSPGTLLKEEIEIRLKALENIKIDPTDNVSVVKKAYAKKLKLHHPEDDPEGYQKLREAYDRALKHLRNNKKTSVDNCKKEIAELHKIVLKEDNLENTKQILQHFNVSEETTENTLSFEELVDKFINEIQILYNNFFFRINIENWITILNSEVMWYLGNKNLLSNRMIEFLVENHYFPAEIWKLLEDNFNWKEQKEYLYEKYPRKFISYLFKQIEDNNGLRYCYFKEAVGVEYDTFLEYREEAFEALSNNDLDFKLFYAKCYINFKEFDKSKVLLLQLLETDSLQSEAKYLLRQVNLKFINKYREELKKDRKNKEIKSKLDKLYKEIGILNSKQIIRKLSYLMIRRVLICSLILLIQVMIIHSAMKNMNIKDVNSLRSIVQFVMVGDRGQLIKNSEDINKLPAEISMVQGKLTNAEFLDLYRIPTKDKLGKLTRMYLSLKGAQAKNLFKDMNGYVCIGTLGDKKVIAIVNYEQASQAYKTKTLDFNGAIHRMPSDSLLSEVKKRCMTNKFEKEFITDKFIDTEVKVSSIRRVTLSIDALLLFVQTSIIIQGLIAGYMLVKVNRKGI